jgi:hypothetical protein
MRGHGKGALVLDVGRMPNVFRSVVNRTISTTIWPYLLRADAIKMRHVPLTTKITSWVLTFSAFVSLRHLDFETRSCHVSRGWCNLNMCQIAVRGAGLPCLDRIPNLPDIANLAS